MLKMRRKKLNNFFLNSKEQKNIEAYKDLLLDWNNNKINLIAKSTEADIDNRHFLDSAQLLNLLTEEEKQKADCADFGTGAGFPGLVLSILGVKNMTLLEKSVQKCNFLKEAIKFSPNKINIINSDINTIKNLKFDIIFSRALANLNSLLIMVKPFIKNDSKCIFLKGKKIFEEIEEAKKHHKFEYKLIDSVTSNEGKIIVLSKIF